MRRPRFAGPRSLVAVAAGIGLALSSSAAAWACSDGEHDGDALHVAAGKWQPVRAGDVVRDEPTGAFKDVEFIGQLPEAVGATAINFIEYKNRSVMFVTGRFGLKSYDISDPENPVLLDSLDMPGFWENEDMDVDPNRKLVFLSRDPRAFGQDQTTGESGVYIVSAKKPHKLEILSFAKVPAGHTTTCVNDCDFLWTGGPMPADWMPEEWTGRPIYVTDIRRPNRPIVHHRPVDLKRDDGVTAYAHDVQVDEAGVAWVSGQGGIRGYWTEGRHFDPVQGKKRRATANNPVPYAGGKFIQEPDVGFPGGAFAHNSLRPTGSIGGHPAGDVALVTIENFSSECATDGRLVAVSLGDSDQGQAWHSTPEDPFRLDIVGEWTPAGKEGTLPDTGCSAHYFELRDGVVAQAFYGNGVRFIDVSDPANPEQIAYYRADGASAWAPYWHGDVMFVADGRRGVDIIRPVYDAAQS